MLIVRGLSGKKGTIEEGFQPLLEKVSRACNQELLHNKELLKTGFLKAALSFLTSVPPINYGL